MHVTTRNVKNNVNSHSVSMMSNFQRVRDLQKINNDSNYEASFANPDQQV